MTAIRDDVLGNFKITTDAVKHIHSAIRNLQETEAFYAAIQQLIQGRLSYHLVTPDMLQNAITDMSDIIRAEQPQNDFHQAMRCHMRRVHHVFARDFVNTDQASQIAQEFRNVMCNDKEEDGTAALEVLDNMTALFGTSHQFLAPYLWSTTAQPLYSSWLKNACFLQSFLHTVECERYTRQSLTDVHRLKHSVN